MGNGEWRMGHWALGIGDREVVIKNWLFVIIETTNYQLLTTNYAPCPMPHARFPS
ncbi:hypothetical protein Osc7112_0465 [Oscillatoria nigro-viridis PCC 7112]|uniref:Uncharacterized protein n=1 Tax=Phormidium nigroviride PCC 7112 TaxID=179408 RepID=K9VC95_9CYAN|nr:hypothetical protein Osc7112_0465 [Oscillatoria nigro-viridis PCC 7112]